MSNHHVRIVGSTDAWQAKCECTQKSKVCKHRWQVEEWMDKHLVEVERIKNHFANRNPSLRDQRKHYLQMENDPDVSEYDRGLWKQLRVQLDHRLGLDHIWVDETMF